MTEKKDILNVFEVLNSLDENVYETIKNHKDELSRWKDDFVSLFIEQVKKGNFTDSENEEAKKLETTLANLYEDIISGDTGEEFWERQSKVGLRYLADGVKLDFLISMVSFLQKKFAEKVFKTYDVGEALKIYQAFKTITDAVLAVIVSGHLDIYIKSIETMSGIKKPVLERMASLECKKILGEA